MSVVAQSPFTGKRLFEDDTSPGSGNQGGGKRARCFESPAGRCRASAHSSPHALHQGVHPSTVAALKALFPGMDQQAVETVLVECGHDIDAAIRRLTELKLGTAEQGASQQAGAASQDTVHPADSAQQQAAGSSSSGTPATAEQWVGALVQEMASAKDFADARARAAKLLQAFEQFVLGRNKQQASGGGVVSQPKVEDVLRENAILKRAVQIQNAKLQEAASTKDQEVAGLKQLLGQYQERLRHLELSNYSLALHLQKATGDRPPGGGLSHRPPDVF